jgi:hypothetical protein
MSPNFRQPSLIRVWEIREFFTPWRGSQVTKNFGQDFDFDHPGRSADRSISMSARVIPKLFDFLMPLIITALALAIGYWGFGIGA